MAEFYRKSSTWVVDYRYDGRPRRIFKVIPDNKDARAMALAQLADLYGSRAELSTLSPLLMTKSSRTCAAMSRRTFYARVVERRARASSAQTLSSPEGLSATGRADHMIFSKQRLEARSARGKNFPHLKQDILDDVAPGITTGLPGAFFL